MNNTPISLSSPLSRSGRYKFRYLIKAPTAHGAARAARRRGLRLLSDAPRQPGRLPHA